MKRARIFLSLVGLFAAVPAVAGAQDRVQPVPGLTGEADAIAAGPDGAMWASLSANPGRIARVTPEGAVSYAAVGGIGGFPLNREPTALTRSGAALWFRLANGPETFAQLRPGFPVSRFGLSYGRPTSLAGGPDGALWMSVAGAPGLPDAISRFTADPLHEWTFTLASDAEPRSIVAGPDGALWFAEDRQLGRITTSGALSYRPVDGAAPTVLASDAGGSLWYAQGDVVHRLDDPAAYAVGSTVVALAAGPDGAMWAAVDGGLARILPDETPTTLGVEPAARPRALAAGPDGRMWLTLDRAPYLVKITVPPRVTEIAEDGDALSAQVNPNGLEATAHAERQLPDGSWTEFVTTPIAAATTPGAVRLPLTDLPGGVHVVRVTATSAAGSVASRALTIERPTRPAVTATPTPVETPAPTPTPTPAPPGPVEGQSVEISVLSGSVSFRAPASKRYTKLTGTTTLPLGVLLDTSAGKVRIGAQVRGKTQTGDFHGGKFSVTQTATGMTEMALAGPLSCSPRDRASVSTRAKKKKKRSIWGKDSGGSFRTRGNGSVATVRGTEWRTEDTCAGTTVYVRKGSVSVWPRRGGKSKLVRAGQRLFTPRPR